MCCSCRWAYDGIIMKAKKPVIGSFVDLEEPITLMAPNSVVTCGENETLNDSLRALLTEKKRKIPVVSDGNHLRGMVSTIDILGLLGGDEKYEMFRKEKKNTGIPVKKFMKRHISVMRAETRILEAMRTFTKGNRGLYPILKSHRLVSVVSEWDFVKLINRPVGIRVGDAMVRRPIFAMKDQKVREIARMMCRGGYRRLPVVEEGILVGVITPTDILMHTYRDGAEKELTRDKTPADNVMSRYPVRMEPEADISDAVDAMRRKNVGGIFVTDEEILTGIITKRDILEVIS